MACRRHSCEDVPDALTRVVRRYGAAHGPFTTAEVRERYGVDAGAALAALEREGALIRGELRPGGSEREWCDPDVLRRLRRASLAALRKEVEAVDQRALAQFLARLAERRSPPRRRRGIDRLRDALVPLQGLALPVEVWEREVLPRRIGAYSPSWMDELCAAGEVVWIGAGALGRSSGRVALYFREDLPLLGAAAVARSELEETLAPHARARASGDDGACFFTDLLVDLELDAREIQEALWDLVWSGVVTNDAFAPLRAPTAIARGRRSAGAAR